MARKRRKKYPFMRFYTSDWIMSTRVLTDEEKSVWIDLLCFMWDNTKQRGTMEGHWFDLARIVGRDRLTFQNCVFSMHKKGVIGMEESIKMGQESYVKLSSSRILKDIKELEKRHLRNKRYKESRPSIRRSNSGLIDAEKTLRSQKSEVRSQNINTSSPNGESVESAAPLTDLQRIVKGWKMLNGIPVEGEESKAWDRVHFKRNARAASSLLTLFGDWRTAWDCVEFVFAIQKRAKLDCTLETVVKRSDLFREQLAKVGR